MSESFDIFVIGAGVAGMKAAEEAVKRKLRVGIAEEGMFGGLIMNINHLHPGAEGLPESGGELAADMMTSVADLGVETLMAPVTAVEPDGSGLIRIETSDGAHSARSVIVASGARLRKLGIAGEEELEHRGVSHCADCDGPLFRNQTVVVVGGGDSALQEAAVLTEYCSAVHIVHRGSAFSARKAFIDALQGKSRITVHFDTIVEAIEGTEAVEGVRLKNVKTGERRRCRAPASSPMSASSRIPRFFRARSQRTTAWCASAIVLRPACGTSLLSARCVRAIPGC